MVGITWAYTPLQLPAAPAPPSDGHRGSPAARLHPRVEEVYMETDVVCGMKVEPTKAPAQSQYQGRMYYFCSTDCKAKFDASPEQYAKTSEQYAR